MIIATAGHIDHGKTTLVKALTGVDTQRPEERARGITIDIGFAHWQPAGGGGSIGFVDVPGHERFVHNMLAGVCGVDCVMLLVAADDGVMPQTVEHLQIVELLGIRQGIAVVTKIDRVSVERVAEVVADVRELLAPTPLAGIGILKVSAITGAGIEALRTAIVMAAAEDRPARGRHRFRCAIDRVFTVAGSGTVVTGTVFDGEVKSGDRLMLSPAGIEVRVRAVQKNGQAAHHACAGERAALNLAGVEVSSVGRGDWVLDSALHAPTRRIDVQIELLAGQTHPLKHWTPVHLHLAAQDLNARIAFRRGMSLAPGQSAFAQLILDRPVAALHGDRFILRDQSALRTLGGGRVVDPFPPLRVNRELRQQQLAALGTDEPGSALHALKTCTPGGIDVALFQRSFNLPDDDLSSLFERTGWMAIGRDSPVALPRESVEHISREIIEALQRFHAGSPQSAGIEVSALRHALAPTLRSGLFSALLAMLSSGGRITVSGSIACIAHHDATGNPADERIWRGVLLALESAGLNGATIAELAGIAGESEPQMADFLYRKSRSRALVRVTPNRFYLRQTLALLAATAIEVAKVAPGGRFTLAAFRDRSGVGRARATEILECLDRLRITQRFDDVRILNEAAARTLGTPAQPSPRVPQAVR